MRGRASADRPKARRGYTLIEVMAVLVLLTVVLGLAMPPIGRLRTWAALRNGRAMVSNALVAARTGATRFQRVSVLTFDGPSGVLSAAVDTSSTGPDPETVVLARFDLFLEHRVTFQVDRSALCFDAVGVATTAPACPDLRAEIVLRRGEATDTIRVNAAGRILR